MARPFGNSVAIHLLPAPNRQVCRSRKEFKEFEELQEFKERSRKGVGWSRDWRGAALARTLLTERCLLYDLFGRKG
jgi:hypothetical protein